MTRFRFYGACQCQPSVPLISSYLQSVQYLNVLPGARATRVAARAPCQSGPSAKRCHPLERAKYLARGQTKHSCIPGRWHDETPSKGASFGFTILNIGCTVCRAFTVNVAMKRRSDNFSFYGSSSHRLVLPDPRLVACPSLLFECQPTCHSLLTQYEDSQNSNTHGIGYYCLQVSNLCEPLTPFCVIHIKVHSNKCHSNCCDSELRPLMLTMKAFFLVSLRNDKLEK